GYWTYYGMSEGFAAVQAEDSRAFEINHYSPARMNIQFKTTGQYAQLLVKVPKANAYFTPKLTYLQNSMSEKMKVYIAPKSAANPKANEYLKGVFNAREKSSTGDTVTLEGFMTNATDTEYIITFENASLGTGHNLLLGSLVLSEEDTKEIKPVKEEYAFNFALATVGVAISTLDTYAKTSRNWKYCDIVSSSKGNTNLERTLAKCLNIVPTDSSGHWFSLTLENISAGTYDIDYTFTTVAQGGIGDIYLAPASVSENSRTNGEYKIGTIDYYEADGAHTKEHTAKLLKTTLTADGDYVITFKHNGTKNSGSSGYQMNPAKLRLTETEPDAAAGTEADEKASFTVQAEKGGRVSVAGDYDVVEDIEIGKSINATATPDDGYVFAYWRNAAGTWLSSNATEDFTINTNTGIIAVFDKIPAESDTEVPVYFYNENGSLIDSKTVEKEKTFGEIKIAQPSIAGFVFDKWSVEDNAVITKLTRAVALYKASDETYDVTVGGTIAASGNYGDFVTVTSSDNNFSYWMLGDDIVSYDKSFTFRVYGNITLTEICEGAKRAQPTVALDVIGENYFLGYTVPAGYVKIEAGILFAKSGTPTIINFNSKASEKTGSGQFVAQASTDGETIARGYVVFKNPEGETRVMYTN
ncbi:MAG: hypothetical protein IJF32_09595, partial [Oscillospiraceae bacterium]|nr:hypothetical protein [Oscillospiraceae bacterium]